MFEFEIILNGDTLEPMYYTSENRELNDDDFEFLNQIGIYKEEITEIKVEKL